MSISEPHTRGSPWRCRPGSERSPVHINTQRCRCTYGIVAPFIVARAGILPPTLARASCIIGRKGTVHNQRHIPKPARLLGWLFFETYLLRLGTCAVLEWKVGNRSHIRETIPSIAGCVLLCGTGIHNLGELIRANIVAEGRKPFNSMMYGFSFLRCYLPRYATKSSSITPTKVKPHRQENHDLLSH